MGNIQGTAEYHINVEALVSHIESDFSSELDKEVKGLLKTLKQLRFKNGKIHANKYQWEKLEMIAYQGLNTLAGVEVADLEYIQDESGREVGVYYLH